MNGFFNGDHLPVARFDQQSSKHDPVLAEGILPHPAEKMVDQEPEADRHN
ncbi:hypothetical protein [Gaopeijia maritima]